MRGAMSARSSLPLGALFAVLLASCAGPPVIRRPGPPVGRGRAGEAVAAESGSRWGVRAETLVTGLELRVRREPTAPAEALTLALPAGRAEGPAAAAVARLCAPSLREAVLSLGGSTRVEVADDVTLYTVIVAPERWRAAVEALGSCLAPPRPPPDALAAALAAARNEPSPPPGALEMEDPALLVDGCYSPSGSGRAPALGAAGPVDEGSLREAAGRLPVPRRSGWAGPEVVPAYLPLRGAARERGFVLALPAPGPRTVAAAPYAVLADLLADRLGEEMARRVGARSIDAALRVGPDGAYLALEASAEGEIQETALGLLDALERLTLADLPVKEVREAASRRTLGVLSEIGGVAERSSVLAERGALGLGPPDPGPLLEALRSVGPENLLAAAGTRWPGTLRLITRGESEPARAAFGNLLAVWERRRESMETEIGPEPGSLPPPGRPGPIAVRKLAGGGVLVFQQDRELPIVAASVRLAGGEVAEPAEISGSTRLMAQGAVRGEVVGGAEVRAVVEEDQFGWDVIALPDLAARAGEEVLRDAALPDADLLAVVRERLLELGAARGARPRDAVMDLARREAFPAHPYGRPPTGLPGSVSGLSADGVAAWARRVLQTRPVVAVVGDMHEEAAVALAESWIAALPEGGPAPTPMAVPPAPPRGEVLRRPGASDWTTQAIAFRTPGRASPDDRGFDLLRVELSRADGPLARSLAGSGPVRFGAVRLEFEKAGLLALVLETSPDCDPEQARLRALNAIREVGRDGAGGTSFERWTVEEGLRGESAEARSSLYAREVLFGRPPTAAKPSRAPADERMRAAAAALLAEEPSIGIVEGVRSPR